MNSSSVLNYFKRTFYLDLRSLALFRITLGLTVFPYVIYLWSNLSVFFSARGVITFKKAWEISYISRIFSVFFWNESPWYYHSLMAIILLSVVMYLIGYRTSFFAFLSWFLLNCLSTRNPYPWHSGDNLMRMCFFWSIFLPVGNLASFGKSQPQLSRTEMQVASYATFALILQIFIEYFFAGLAKTGTIWPNGYGVYFVSRLTMFSTQFSSVLAGLDLNYLKLLSYLTLFSELIIPFLLFIPNRKSITRIIFLFFIFGLHISIAIFMYLDIFPFVCISLLCAIFPAQLWERKWTFNQNIKFQRFSKFASCYLLVVIGVVFFLNFYSAILNVSGGNKKLYFDLRRAEAYLGVTQEWGLFAMATQPFNTWTIVVGRTKTGELIDVFRDGRPPLFQEPGDREYTYRSAIWGKYFQSLEKGYIIYVGYSLSRYYCREWNKKHPEQPVVTVDVGVMRRMIPFPGEEQKPAVRSVYSLIDCATGRPPTKE